MTGTADPHEPPCLPALLWDAERSPDVALTGGPDRIYDPDAADPAWTPRPVGFAPRRPTETEPLLWDGDQA